MPTKPMRFDSDRIEQHVSARVDVNPDQAELAARCVTRHLGDQAGDVLRALGLATTETRTT